MNETRLSRNSKSETEENIRLASWMVEHPYREKEEKKKDWLQRMFEENGIFNRSNNSRSSKETFLKNKYKKTKQWAQESGQDLLETEGVQSFQGAITKLCPWFWILDQEYDRVQQDSPSYNNINGKIIKTENDLDTENNLSRESYTESKDQDESNENVQDLDSSELGSARKKFCRDTEEIEITNSSVASTSGKKNNFSDTILKLYSARQEDKNNEQNAMVKVKLAQLDFEREKWQWNRDQENIQRKHEKEMMELKIRELQLQLEIKQAELKLKSQYY
uniref:Uncharacterized protein n=1 Tax=Strigamia maritima TaxID=126957 RepID=T1JN17_STRMM